MITSDSSGENTPYYEDSSSSIAGPAAAPAALRQLLELVDFAAMRRWPRPCTHGDK